jgi:hypothetical protein
VSGLIVTLLRMARLSRAWCGAVAILPIWFYTAATGWEASALRASVMMTIVFGGWALMRPCKCQFSLFELSRFPSAPSRLETWVQLPRARYSAIHLRLRAANTP